MANFSIPIHVLIFTFFITISLYAEKPSAIFYRIFHIDTATEIDRQQIKRDDNLTMLGNVYFDNVKPFKIIIVDKNNKKLYIVSIKNNSFKILETFPALFGANNGNKLVQGDKKTPEGVYYVTGYKSEADLYKQFGSDGSIYGTGAFPLNYPNPIDRLRSKTGGGIWLHGIGVDDKNATSGCVAVENNCLNIIKTHLYKSAPVIISDKLLFQDINTYRNDRQTLKKSLIDFISSHQDKNQQKYQISNLKIFRHNNIDTVFDFDMATCKNNITEIKNIRYYFSTDYDNKTKLVSQEILPVDISPIITKEINTFINSWLSSWTSKNYNKFIAHYSKDFNGYKMNYPLFSAMKKRAFNNDRDISIKLKNIRWQEHNGYYLITFDQDYRNDLYHNTGKKTMLVTRCIGEYKIINESWENK